MSLNPARTAHSVRRPDSVRRHGCARSRLGNNNAPHLSLDGPVRLLGQVHAVRCVCTPTKGVEAHPNRWAEGGPPPIRPPMDLGWPSPGYMRPRRRPHAPSRRPRTPLRRPQQPHQQQRRPVRSAASSAASMRSVAVDAQRDCRRLKADHVRLGGRDLDGLQRCEARCTSPAIWHTARD